jgi:hypothetical protein
MATETTYYVIRRLAPSLPLLHESVVTTTYLSEDYQMVDGEWFRYEELFRSQDWDQVVTFMRENGHAQYRYRS